MMTLALEKALAGSEGEPIRVDVDALWRKAIEASHDEKRQAQHNAIDPQDTPGELAVISAWARGRGRKG